MVVKKYYVTGNTAQGQIDLIASNVKGMKKIIKLDHPSYKRNTFILEGIIEAYQEQTSVEILKSPINSRYLEGVILRDRQVAIIANRGFSVPSAYDCFAEGLRIHDELEQVYIQEMNFTKADQAAEALIDTLFKDVPRQDNQSYILRRFFGTNTMDGVVNEVPHIISELDHAYHIKGRAGTGKSTFMKKIVHACENHGLHIELYHCSFDSNSIDMVLIPLLKTCLFDSTDPHELMPDDQSREKVIDLYDIAVAPGTDEKYHEEIALLTSKYKSFMKKGLQELEKYGEEIVVTEEAKTFSNEELNGSIEEILMEIERI